MWILETDYMGFQSWLHYIVRMWRWASYFKFSVLLFSPAKWITLLPSSNGYFEGWVRYHVECIFRFYKLLQNKEAKNYHGSDLNRINLLTFCRISICCWEMPTYVVWQVKEHGKVPKREMRGKIKGAKMNFPI